MNTLPSRTSKLLLVSLIAISCTTATFSDESPLNAAKALMGKAADMATKAVQETSESATKAAKKAVDDAKTAVAKLPSFKLGSLTQNGEPEEPSKDFKWTPENIRLAVDGDAKLGEALAKKGKCSKCHGDTGISEDDDTPSIAGQISAYAFKQLHDYKEGLRESKSMLKKVRNLSSKDMADISAWYATQEREQMLGTTEGGKVPVLAIAGDPARFILGCNTCHNEDAMNRGYQIPILEGQKVEYFIETMLAFKEGDRENDHYNLMRGISEKLTEEEIETLAKYYSAKPSEE